MLTTILSSLSHLKSLGLTDNSLEGRDVRAIVLALPTTLTALSLGRNPMGESGIEHLARLSGLRDLDLRSINTRGYAPALIMALSSLSNLTRLNLEENNLGDVEAMMATVAALPTTLTALTLQEDVIIERTPLVVRYMGPHRVEESTPSITTLSSLPCLQGLKELNFRYPLPYWAREIARKNRRELEGVKILPVLNYGHPDQGRFVFRNKSKELLRELSCPPISGPAGVS